MSNFGHNGHVLGIRVPVPPLATSEYDPALSTLEHVPGPDVLGHAKKHRVVLGTRLRHNLRVAPPAAINLVLELRLNSSRKKGTNTRRHSGVTKGRK